MTAITSLNSLILDLPPSCVAFCPTLSQFFVVGTYYLHPKEQDPARDTEPAQENDNAGDDPAGETPEQKRTGSLILFRLDGEKITPLSTTATDFAILDVQWMSQRQESGNILAVAASTGQIQFFNLHQDTGKSGNLALSHFATKTLADASVLVLSLACHPSKEHILGATLSNGKVCICSSLEQEGVPPWTNESLIQIHNVYQHELEAWTVALTGDYVFSGGDDIVLQCSMFTGEGEAEAEAGPVLLWQDRKIHQAGVTALLPLPRNLVLTGSYDDHVRLFSCPPGGRAALRAELNLGGGVWRLKLLTPPGTPSAETGADAESEDASLMVLASCMHAGSRILRLRETADGTWEFDVTAKFEEHQSMNYGGDVQPRSDGKIKAVVSTSFYDKLLCLWHFQ